MAYCEDVSPAVGDERQISLIVRDIAAGHEQCFRIDLESGETAPCP